MSTPRIVAGLVLAVASAVTVSSSICGQTLNESAKLLATDGASYNNLGRSCAINGTRAIVGTGAFSTGPGAAYIFDLATGQQLHKLIALNGAVGDSFGGSVAISGSMAIVGADGDGDNGLASGSAYLFDVVTGQQLLKLVPADGATVDRFGGAVGISGGTAIIGAHRDDDFGNDSGSAYLFDTSTGQQITKLLPNDSAVADQFGISVAMDGNTAIVGSWYDDDMGNLSGAAYVFDVGTGQQIAKLVPSDGQAFDQFGVSVAISGTTVIVGSALDDDNGVSSGSAYLFHAITGLQTAKLLPSGGAPVDVFGISVSTSASLAIVGAFYDDDNGLNSGSAYIFDVGTGKQVSRLLPSDGEPKEYFGYAVGIDGAVAVVGAHLDDTNGTSSGSAYLFDVTGDCVAADTVTRNGSGLNAMILTRVSDPVLGESWETDLDCTGHSSSFAGLEVFEQASSGFFLAGGELLVDVTSSQATRALATHTGGVVRFSIDVPGDISLCGFTASSQGVVFGAPGYALSNALDVVAGF